MELREVADGSTLLRRKLQPQTRENRRELLDPLKTCLSDFVCVQQCSAQQEPGWRLCRGCAQTAAHACRVQMSNLGESIGRSNPSADCTVVFCRASSRAVEAYTEVGIPRLQCCARCLGQRQKTPVLSRSRLIAWTTARPSHCHRHQKHGR